MDFTATDDLHPSCCGCPALNAGSLEETYCLCSSEMSSLCMVGMTPALMNCKGVSKMSWVLCEGSQLSHESPRSHISGYLKMLEKICKNKSV